MWYLNLKPGKLCTEIQLFITPYVTMPLLVGYSSIIEIIKTFIPRSSQKRLNYKNSRQLFKTKDRDIYVYDRTDIGVSMAVYFYRINKNCTVDNYIVVFFNLWFEIGILNFWRLLFGDVFKIVSFSVFYNLIISIK
jgi:hypothetical protein